MVAAIAAAREGAEVTILERGDRIGKKLLLTGNGKCNLGNRHLNASLYGTDAPLRLEHCLEVFGTEQMLSFFEQLGLLTMEKNGGLYPLANQASAVLDVLRFALSDLGVKLYTGCFVRELCPDQDRWQVIYEVDGKKQDMIFDRVILAAGGRALPRTGSDGRLYQVAGDLGHHVLPVRPALCALRVSEDLKSLAGVRTMVRARLRSDEGGEILMTEEGEAQFNADTLSGIVIFQMSAAAGEIMASGKTPVVDLDCLPYWKDRQLEELIACRRQAMAGRCAEEYFAGVMNKKLLLYFLHGAGIREKDPMDEILKRHPGREKRVWENARAFSLHVKDTVGFENAQSSTGGIPLGELSDSLESCLCPGLYMTGEMINVLGPCGGYNLHWAWCSGVIAGRAAAK